jgi:hypothetical protein
MDSVKRDFKERKDEIDAYFSFLSILSDEENILLKDRSKNILNILISNGFLLLYNFIEATLRNAILEIYDVIENKEITFEQLSENMKKIWIEQSSSHLSNFTQNVLNKHLFEITKSILTQESISFSKEKFSFSGNLDAKKIREIAKQYGFQMSSNGRNLVTIKNKRNHLAHGNFTFSEIGKDFTVGELESFKDETLAFLSDIINNIEKFIIQKQYLRNN